MRQREFSLAGELARRMPLLTVIAVLSLTVLLGLGCADSSTATTQRGDALMRDPMGYKASADNFPDISGGDITHFDKKGFQRDLDSVLNP